MLRLSGTVSQADGTNLQAIFDAIDAGKITQCRNRSGDQQQPGAHMRWSVRGSIMWKQSVISPKIFREPRGVQSSASDRKGEGILHRI